MSLKIKIAARLKAKAAGVNLSQKRVELIVARAEKGGLTDESDDTAIDAQLDIINELTPFTELASLDDHQRAKDKKTADDKEAARLKAIEDGKPAPAEPDPNETPTEKLLKQALAGINALTAEVSTIKGEKVTNTRREQIAKLLENTTDAYKADKLADFDLLGFKDDDSFEAYKTSLETRSKDFAKPEGAEGGIGDTFRPTGGAGGNAGAPKVISDTDLDAIMNAI